MNNGIRGRGRSDQHGRVSHWNKSGFNGYGISDGDEVMLGLDPLNPQTHGIPDSLYCITRPTLKYCVEEYSEEFPLTQNLCEAGVTVKGKISNETGEMSYYYDYTVPLSKIM